MIRQWDYEKFKLAVAAAADAMNISRETLYDELSQRLHISSRTVKKYQTPAGTPGADAAKKLREFFGIDFYSYDSEAAGLLRHLSGADAALSDFSKARIFESLTEIQRFITDPANLEEDRYCRLRETLDENALGMPVGIADAIAEFAQTHIAPLIYQDPFAPCRAGSIGYERDDGVFVVEAEEEFFAAIFSVIADVEQEFRKLAQTLRPLLVS